MIRRTLPIASYEPGQARHARTSAPANLARSQVRNSPPGSLRGRAVAPWVRSLASRPVNTAATQTAAWHPRCGGLLPAARRSVLKTAPTQRPLRVRAGQGPGKADDKPAPNRSGTPPEERRDPGSAGGFGGRVAGPGDIGLCPSGSRVIALLDGLRRAMTEPRRGRMLPVSGA
jgi:hypothetical protein